MKTSAARIAIALALWAVVLVCGPGAQAAPIAITHCQNINNPGSYILQNNISATGNCLIINASSVSINLNGFSITGPGSLSGTGIQTGSGVEFTTIQYGSVSNFGTCIQLEGDGTAVIESVKASGCLNVITAGGIVRGNIIACAPSGSAGQFTGLITGNLILNCHNGPQVGELGSGSTMIGNTITTTEPAHSAGLYATCPVNVLGNPITGYGFDDISITQGSNCNFSNNLTDEGGLSNRPAPVRR